MLDLQDGGVVVQDGQDNLIHVLPETEIDFLLFLQSFHQLKHKNRATVNAQAVKKTAIKHQHQLSCSMAVKVLNTSWSFPQPE